MREQVPSAAAPLLTVQASHGPVHVASQHTPSTQRYDWQSPPDEHGSPSCSLGTHSALTHQYPKAQEVPVSTHEVGQLTFTPSHVYGWQAEEEYPADAVVQMPSEPDALQRSQGLSQAESQHLPSTQ